MPVNGKLSELLQAKPINKKKLIEFSISEKLNAEKLIAFTESFGGLKKDYSNLTPLHAACILNEPNIVEVLLKEGWEVNLVGELEPPLWLALKNGNVAIAQMLIKGGAEVYYTNWCGMTLMAPALFSDYKKKDENNCIECVKILLNAGISLNAEINFNTRTLPIHRAADNSQHILLTYLIEKGADINVRDTFKYTPLMISTIKNSLECLKVLIRNEVDLYAEDKKGYTALKIAVDRGSKQVVETLVKGGYNINHIPTDSCTVLQFAVLKRNRDMIKLLLDLGADPNLCTGVNAYPLQLAATPDIAIPWSEDKKTLQVRIDIAEFLFENGANVNVSVNEFLTPLSSAIFSEFYGLAKLFVSLGANVNSIHKCQGTLFHLVATLNHNIIELFLKYGGNYNSHNKKGLTPYTLAILHRIDLKFIKCFVKFGCPYDQNINALPGLKNQTNWRTDRFFRAEKRFFKGIKENTLELVQKAVEDGAVVNGCSEEIKYPVHFLAFHGYNQLLDYLLSEGVSPNMLNERGESALYIAAQLGHYECCCTLLKFGACYSYKKKFIDSIQSKRVGDLLQNVHKMFALTSEGCQKVIIKLNNLLNKNNDEFLIYTNARNWRGDSLLATALHNNHTSIARELLKLRIQFSL